MDDERPGAQVTGDWRTLSLTFSSMRGITGMAALPQDLRYAFRTLRKARLFSAVVFLSLAFGIGADTAIFTLIHQLIRRRPPVKDPQQLVMLAGRGRHYGGNNGRDKPRIPCTRISATRIRCRATISAYWASAPRSAGSGDLYQGGHPLAVLSYGYWKSRFAGDPDIVGKKIMANGYPLTVIGVSQPGFDGVEPRYAPQISRLDYDNEQPAPWGLIQLPQRPPFSLGGGLRPS